MEWNRVPCHPPAATWATGVSASEFWRRRRAAGSHWKGPGGTFYLEHSSTARPTRQLSNHLIKSQLLRPSRATCNLPSSSTNLSITQQARSLHLLTRFPFSSIEVLQLDLHSTLRFCDTPQHPVFPTATHYRHNTFLHNNQSPWLPLLVLIWAQPTPVWVCTVMTALRCEYLPVFAFFLPQTPLQPCPWLRQLATPTDPPGVLIGQPR